MRGIAIGLCVLCCLSAHPSAARAEDASQQAKAAYEKAMAEFGLGNYAQAAAEYENAFRFKPDGALLYNAAQAHRLAGNKKRALDLYRNYTRLYGTKSSLGADAKKRIGELERAIAEGGTAPSSPAAPPVTASPAATASPATPAGGGVTGQSPETPPPTSQHSAPHAPAVPPNPAPPSPALPGPAPTSPVSPGPPAPSAAPLPPATISGPPPASAAPPPATGPEALTSLQGANQSSDGPKKRSLLASPLFWGGVAAVVVAGAVLLLVALRPSYPDASLGHGSL